MSRLTKRIKILTLLDDYPWQKESEKTYRSYKAVMKTLKPGEEVLVSVEEGWDDFFIHMGYGYVSLDEKGEYWSHPRHLMPEY